MTSSPLTIGIPDKKGQKYVYVFLKDVSFEKKSNYFITSKFEPVYPSKETNVKTLRTEVQRNTSQPQFKTRSFSFKLPTYFPSPSSENKTPSDPFPPSPLQQTTPTSVSNKFEKFQPKLEEATNPTILLQVSLKHY